MMHRSETLPLAELSHRRTLSPPIVTGLRIALEAAAIILAAFASNAAYHVVAYQVTGPGFVPLEFGAAFATLFAIISFYRDDLRQSGNLTFRKSAQRLFQTFSLAFVAVIVVGFFTKTSDIHSRGTVLVFYGLGLASLVLVRTQTTRLIDHVTRAGWVSAGRIMIVGFSRELTSLLGRSAPQDHGFDVLAIEPLSHPFEATREQIAVSIEAIVERARRLQPDTIILAIPWSHSNMIDQCVRAFMNLPVRVELAPERVLERFADLRIARLGPQLTLNVLRPPMGHTGRAAKRLFDLTFALLGLIALLPLFLIVSALIRLESNGPALFRQTRYGFNQRPFRIWKFRTMNVMDDGAQVQQASRDDVRITRIGSFLRRWNIDELPQLINVLIGDMSLVGPRPHAVAHNRHYEGKIDLYARRHNVRPGITGWAQVNGLRGATDEFTMQKRVEFDLYYLDNWSLTFDVGILFMTVFSRRSYRNAY